MHSGASVRGGDFPVEPPWRNELPELAANGNTQGKLATEDAVRTETGEPTWPQRSCLD